ncbi:mechanosensitive ion channel family protein, partial [Candidatus Parcubacteria bacterium]
VQNILSDLFSSFTILVDKPFVPGDFIVVGEHMGVVEKIGIKTTRLRALQGEEIVISNRELTATRIQNFKRMKARRVLFRIGVVYETPSELLEQIPDLVRDIIARQKNVAFDRAHFSSFDDSSLTFEIVYYVNSGDYKEYMDVHQRILFAIKREFERRGISMAYPTRTVYLARESAA